MCESFVRASDVRRKARTGRKGVRLSGRVPKVHGERDAESEGDDDHESGEDSDSAAGSDSDNDSGDDDGGPKGAGATDL